jgi:parallel beta-helix repeat protein
LQAIKTITDDELGEILPASLWTDKGVFLEHPFELEIDYWIGIPDGTISRYQKQGELLLLFEGFNGTASDTEMSVIVDGSALLTLYDEPADIIAPQVKAVDAPNNTIFGKMATYESPDFPFMIQYPAAWEKQPILEGVTALFMGDLDEGLVIAEEEWTAIPSSDMKLEEYTDITLSYLQESMPDFQLLSREQHLTKDGHPVEILTFTNEDGQVKASRFVYVHDRNSAINATYFAPTERFDLLSSVIDYSYGTFEVVGEFGAVSDTSSDGGDATAADAGESLIEQSWTIFAGGFGPPDSAVRDVAVADDGSIWIATGGSYKVGGENFGGVAQLKDQAWTIYGTEDGLANDNVWAVEIAPDGTVWFGTEDGVSAFDGKEWTNYTEDDGLLNDSVRAMAIEPNGAVWVATRGGASRFDGSSWTNYTATDGLADNTVNDIAVAPGGIYWFGTPSGVSRFDGENWQTYTVKNGLAHDYVLAVAVAPDGAIWFGAGEGFGLLGGVSRFDGETWTTYSTEDGLVDNNVNDIVFGDGDVIWFGTANFDGLGGVSKFDGENWTNFTTADGLASNIVEAITLAPDGAIWIGTWDGLSRYQPALAPSSPDTTVIHVAPGDGGDFADLKTAIENAEPGAVLILEPGSYDLENPLDIDKAISIKGSGVDQTEIITEAGGYVIRFSGSGPFVIEDLAVRHVGDTPASTVVVESGVVAFSRCAFMGAVTMPEENEWHAGLLVKGDATGTIEACAADKNSGDGIWLDDQSAIQLIDNIITDNSGDGIYVGGEAQPTIKGNTCSANGMAGIKFAGEASGEARENECSQNQEGIAVTGQAQPLLENNICQNNQFAGIVFTTFAGGVARQNECTGNDVGIEVSGSAIPTLEGNICSDNVDGIKILEGAEVGLEGAAEPTLEGNICRNNEETGIKYLDGTGGTASKNECSENGGPGIFVAEQAQPTLLENICTNNATAGIQYDSEAGGLAQGNDTSDNGWFGFEVGGEAKPTLERNICSGNAAFGIGYFDESAGVARKNECSENDSGIVVANQARPSLEENILSDNVKDGFGYMEDAGGRAKQNECYGNNVGLFLAENADPELIDNNCHDNTEADVKDIRP